MAGEIAQKMKSIVRDRVNDKAGTRWSDPDIYAYLNEGQQALAHYLCDGALWQLTSVEQTDLVDATNNYDLPSDFLRERLVKYKTIVARRWTVEEIDALRANPQTAPTEANPFYYIWAGDIYFPEITVIQTNGDQCEIWYIKQPTDMSDAVDPDFGKQFHNLIEDFAVSRCLEQGDGDFGQAEVQAAHFLEQCLLINSRYRGGSSFEGIPADPRLSVLIPGGNQ